MKDLVCFYTTGFSNLISMMMKSKGLFFYRNMDVDFSA